MSVIYVKEQGAVVKKLGERVVITKNTQTLLDIPAFQVDNIALIGNVQVTSQALHMLMEQGVDISHFSYSGRYLGHTSAEMSRNIFLRFEQYGYYTDLCKRLIMARRIVDNKIGNQIAIIRMHRFSDDYDWKANINSMLELRRTLPDKQTSNEILGVEGMCSHIYFKAFGRMIKGDFEFHGRNRRPPRDPINAVISLAYTFLTKEVMSALDAESFETYLGFLHGIRYGRKSLALDMVEEFRQPAVDRLVMLLFGKKMLNYFDFEFPEEGGVVLTEEGFRKFCTEYERWMTGQNSASGENTFRSRIKEQVGKLKKAIVENKDYMPYSWEDRRNVSGEL